MWSTFKSVELHKADYLSLSEWPSNSWRPWGGMNEVLLRGSNSVFGLKTATWIPAEISSLLSYFVHIRISDLPLKSSHSSTLAWKIPWREEPGGLQSMGSLRVGHDWVTSLSLFTLMHWRRKWQPTPVFLPWESQGQGSLVGCRRWGCTESDTTEVT